MRYADRRYPTPRGAAKRSEGKFHMRLRGLIAGTVTAALLSGSAGYGIALARADDSASSARESRPAATHDDAMSMHGQMTSEHGQMMRDPKMRESHRRMMRDPEMRKMHRHMMRDPMMREMHRTMGDVSAGAMRGRDMRGG